MAHCPYEKIKKLEPVFARVRKLDKIKEPKPGIFYLKGQGFLHFHINKEGAIWGDIRDGKGWTRTVDIPDKISVQFVKSFSQFISAKHSEAIGLT